MNDTQTEIQKLGIIRFITCADIMPRYHQINRMLISQRKHILDKYELQDTIKIDSFVLLPHLPQQFLSLLHNASFRDDLKSNEK